MAFIGIYKIQSKKKSKKIYIGSSVDIYTRWRKHLDFLSQNKHHNQKLQNHFNKYGKSDLVFSIIICCDKDLLVSMEQFFIDSYNPWFNIMKKASNTHYTKKTQVPWNKGMKNQYKVLIPCSDERKEKIRLANLKNGNKPPSQKDKTRSLETRKKMSNSVFEHYRKIHNVS